MADPLILTGRQASCGDGTLSIDRLSVEPGRITFILGKQREEGSALLSMLAEFPGVFMAKAPADGEFSSVSAFLSAAAARHSAWDPSVAQEALEEFGLKSSSPADAYTCLLLGAVEALACREPYVLIDQPAEGLRDKDRKSFYLLMRDFCRGETAFVASVSEIGDAEIIIDDVIFLNHGKVVIAEEKRSLLGRAAYVSGHCRAVAAETAGREKYGERSNGKITTVVCLLAKDESAVGGSCDVSVMNIGLQTLFDFMCAD
ncbi:MAG: hypothetical protein II784_04770 [Oscillospiraceae bacterium]|nr:hypothetical protein [Oscillospiraceae bacterium]